MTESEPEIYPSELIEDRVCLNLSWKRPDNIPYPNIWKKVEVNSKNGETYRVQIEDVTPNRFEEFIDFMGNNLDCHEPLCRALHLTSDPESVAARKEFRRKALQQRISLIATLQNSQNNDKNPEIMSTLVLVVSSKNDPPIKIAGNKYTMMTDFFTNYVNKGADSTFQLFNSDIYIGSFGLAVAPKYYKLGLGYEIFACIPQIMKAFNIPGSRSTFTSPYSQAIGKKVGFELYKEVSFREYKDKVGNTIFPMEGTVKVMILRKDEENKTKKIFVN